MKQSSSIASFILFFFYVYSFKDLFCRYIATIEGSVNRRHLVAISEGTLIDGSHCVPDSVELLPVQPEISRPRLRIVVLTT